MAVLAFSYAWKDQTEENAKARTDVEAFCEDAKAKGIKILRDVDEIGLGDEMSRYIERFSQDDRLYIFLRHAYLQRYDLMLELYELWRNSSINEAKFRRAARIFVLPCAKIWDKNQDERFDYSEYWQHKTAKFVAEVFDQIKENKDIAKSVNSKVKVHHFWFGYFCFRMCLSDLRLQPEIA